MNSRLTREEIALRIFCALVGPEDRVIGPDDRLFIGNDDFNETMVRGAFRLAETFERLSDELGERPDEFDRKSFSGFQGAPIDD